MRAAPSASILLADTRAERRLVLLLHGMSGMVLAAWLAGWLAPDSAGPRPAIQWAGILAASLLSAGYGRWVSHRLLPQQPLTRLHWSGQAWSLQRVELAVADAVPIDRLQVRIDLGTWLLLSWRGPGGPWGVLRARVGAEQGEWHGMRLALGAHAVTGLPRRT